ncbi:FG-GAP-like repeat-containing protein [Danxiaibacter flavus]|uniref:FG-GAP-like repeat-containing protein n=1 Tax=Danxiaibacter flavus TaxID=3049108 RepID=A0ABV3ZIG5_9BACT|nr:FG-GAP-like repeat-containing protein [Chitinophagaceae bacterium DXS]
MKKTSTQLWCKLQPSKLLACISLLFFTHSASTQQPVITSFTPLQGAKGTTVTIQGQYFASTTQGNTVYFGAARAIVSRASATSLTVTVPTGASYGPISVTANSRTGRSKDNFIFTFTDNGDLSQGAFGTAAPIVPNSGTAFKDLDGDGRLDMLVISSSRQFNGVYYDFSTLSFYRNMGSAGYVNFKLSGTFKLPQSPAFYLGENALTDLDGDGRPDLVLSARYDSIIKVYKNISTSGKIQFEPPVDFKVNERLNYTSYVHDIDGDGLADFIGVDIADWKIFRNTSANGKISFSTTTSASFFLRGANSHIEFGDIDADGKIDALGANGNQYVDIVKNNSTPGNFIFEYHSLYIGTNTSWDVAVGDVNGDLKPDLAVTDVHNNTVSVLQNNGTAGTIIFSPAITFPTGSFPLQVLLNDLNGDGKADIQTFGQYSEDNTTIALLKNTGMNGNIAFDPAILYNDGNFNYINCVNDIDNDAKPDIVVGYHTYSTRYETYILKNQVKTSSQTPVITHVTPTGGIRDTITINGNYLSGVSSITLGDSAVQMFSILSDSKIKAVVGGGATGVVKVTSAAGTAVYNKFTYSTATSISIKSTLPSSGCKEETTLFKTIIRNQPSGAYYDWFKNGVRVGNRNAEYRTTRLLEGDSVWAVLTTNTLKMKSNVITAHIDEVLKPTIKISTTKTDVCKNTPVTFKATITNGDSSASYQWIKNNAYVGTNSDTYTNNTPATGDSVACILNLARNCAIVPITSNYIKITVTREAPAQPSPIDGPSVVNSNEAGLMFSVINDYNVSSYQWLVPSGTTITSGKNTNAITITWNDMPGKISVKASNACGSQVVAKSVQLAPQQAPSIAEITDFSVYPNPAKEKINISINSLNDGKFIMELRTQSGQVLQSQKMQTIKSRLFASFEVASYAPGMYYVIAIDEKKQSFSRRILISR